jgi:hypothetical protein
MLPTYTALFEAHRWLCISRRVRYRERELHDAQIGIARARLLAAMLAAGDEDIEPAALLLALLLEAAALGDARNAFPVVAVQHFVRTSRHLTLTVDLVGHLELGQIRARALPHRHAPDLLREALSEVGAFLAARLQPRQAR